MSYEGYSAVRRNRIRGIMGGHEGVTPSGAAKERQLNGRTSGWTWVPLDIMGASLSCSPTSGLGPFLAFFPFDDMETGLSPFYR